MKPYKYLFQSPRLAREYKELLDSMDTDWLIKCYKNPNPWTQHHHQGMLQAVLEDRGVEINGIR